MPAVASHTPDSCNLRNVHDRIMHCAKPSRGLDWLREIFHPFTFPLLPAALSRVLARGYGFRRHPLQFGFSVTVPRSTAVARHALEGRHRQGNPNYKSMNTLIKRTAILIFVTMLLAMVGIGCHTAHGFG